MTVEHVEKPHRPVEEELFTTKATKDIFRRSLAAKERVECEAG